MRLEIRAFGGLNKLLRQGPMEFDGRLSIEALLTQLAQRYGTEFERQVYDTKTGMLNPGICITVNGRIVAEADLKNPVEENDRIAIFTFLAGG